MPVENMQQLIFNYLKASALIHDGSHDFSGDRILNISPEIIDGEQGWTVTVCPAFVEGTEDVVVLISDLLLFIANSKAG